MEIVSCLAVWQAVRRPGGSLPRGMAVVFDWPPVVHDGGCYMSVGMIMCALWRRRQVSSF